MEASNLIRQLMAAQEQLAAVRATLADARQEVAEVEKSLRVITTELIDAKGG